MTHTYGFGLKNRNPRRRFVACLGLSLAALIAGCFNNPDDVTLGAVKSDCETEPCEFIGWRDAQQLAVNADGSDSAWNGWLEAVRESVDGENLERFVNCKGEAVTVTYGGSAEASGRIPPVRLIVTRWAGDRISCLSEVTIVSLRIPAELFAADVAKPGSSVDVLLPAVGATYRLQ